jgi:hypothetical protein
MLLGVIWIVSLRRVLVFSMIDNWEVIYCIDRWCLSRPPIIRSHDLHVDDIRETMGEIMSYCNQKEKGR